MVNAVAGTLVSAALVFWLQTSAVRWEAQAPSTCMPDSCFCEADRGGGVRQPANTWSNLAYVFLGLLILGAGVRPGAANPFRSDPAHVWAYGLTAVALGLTSAWFHASLTFLGEWFDGMSMYLLVSLLVAHNLRRGGAVGRTGFLAAYGVLGVASGLFLAFSPVLRKESFGALVASLVVAEVWARRRSAALDGRWFAAAFASFIVAFGIWLLDYYRIVCSPGSLLQGHAVWHLLCAGTIGLLFLYYRGDTQGAPGASAPAAALETSKG